MLRRFRPWLLVAFCCAAIAVFWLPLTSDAQPAGALALVSLRNVQAPHPQLVAPAAQSFARARARMIAWCGRDFLGVLDEALRPVNYTTTKDGVAQLSWHKAGRAIDVHQGTKGLVVITDPKAPRFKRLLLRCARQDGTQGGYFGPKGLQRRGKPGWYVDVTGVLLAEGWNRIPARGRVGEWWHFEYQVGVRSWQHAMQQIYSRRTLQRLYPRSFNR